MKLFSITKGERRFWWITGLLSIILTLYSFEISFGLYTGDRDKDGTYGIKMERGRVTAVLGFTKWSFANDNQKKKPIYYCPLQTDHMADNLRSLTYFHHSTYRGFLLTFPLCVTLLIAAYLRVFLAQMVWLWQRFSDRRKSKS